MLLMFMIIAILSLGPWGLNIFKKIWIDVVLWIIGWHQGIKVKMTKEKLICIKWMFVKCKAENRRDICTIMKIESAPNCCPNIFYFPFISNFISYQILLSDWISLSYWILHSNWISMKIQSAQKYCPAQTLWLLLHCHLYALISK